MSLLRASLKEILRVMLKNSKCSLITALASVRFASVDNSSEMKPL